MDLPALGLKGGQWLCLAVFLCAQTAHGQWFMESQNYAHMSVCFNTEMEPPYRGIIDERGKRFVLHVPGLNPDAGSNSVSFESVDYPGWYMRHSKYELYLESSQNPQNPTLYKDDSTFIIHANKKHNGFYSFESYNYPGYYIRHQKYELKISSEANETGEVWDGDISWRFLHKNIMLQPKFQETCRSIHCKVTRDTYNQSIYTEKGLKFNLVSPGPSGLSHTVGFESVDNPGSFLREYGAYAYIDHHNSMRSPGTWSRDATFKLEYNVFTQGYLSITSTKDTGMYFHVLAGESIMRFDRGNDDALFADEASFRLVEGPIYLDSQDQEGYAIDFNFNGDYEALLTKTGHKFNMVYPGLTESKGTASFESYWYPGYYMRHYKEDLYLENSDNPTNPDTYAGDATFRMQMDLWFEGAFTYQAVNYHNYSIRHTGDLRLRIEAFEDTEEFKGDSSYMPREAPVDTTAPGPPGGGSSTNVGAIVGGVFGILALIALVIAIIFFTNRKFAWTDTVQRRVSEIRTGTTSSGGGVENPSYGDASSAHAQPASSQQHDETTQKPSTARRLSRSLSNTMAKLKPTKKASEPQAHIDVPSGLPPLSADDFQPTAEPVELLNPFDTQSSNKDRQSVTNPMFDLKRMSTTSTGDDSLEIYEGITPDAKTEAKPSKVSFERQDSIFDTSPTLQANDDPFGMFSQPPAEAIPSPKVAVANDDDPFSIFGDSAPSEPVYATVDKSKKSIAPDMSVIKESDDWDSLA